MLVLQVSRVTRNLIWPLRAFAVLLCTSMIWWMLWVDFQRQDLARGTTDFANSCYVAGTIAQSGNISSSIRQSLLQITYIAVFQRLHTSC